MKCSFCNTEMLEGYIPALAIEWVPKYGNAKLKYTGSKTDDFRIGRMHLLSLKKQSAWYCPNCDLIIIRCK